MDEIKVVFYEDVKDKTITARGSHNVGRRYNNNKTYTRKELKQMNGQTYTMNVNEFIPFKEFRKLPDNMQQEYIEALVAKYGVCKTSFAKMWGVDPSTSWKIFKDFGIESPKWDSKKEKKFLREMKPKNQKESVEVEDVNSEVKENTKQDAMSAISADIIIDRTQVDTDIVFHNHEEIFRFFSRFVPLNAEMHLTFLLEKKRGEER